MKTMGLHRLTLVRPKLFPNAEATAMASGADDLLMQAAVVDDLDTALSLYEAERLPRTSRVQLDARERGRTYHLSDSEAKAKRDAEYREQQKKNPHAGGIKTDWVYSYNATDFQPKALQV